MNAFDLRCEDGDQVFVAGGELASAIESCYVQNDLMVLRVVLDFLNYRRFYVASGHCVAEFVLLLQDQVAFMPEIVGETLL